MRGMRFLCAICAAFAPAMALAQAETTTFCYDALGRMTQARSIEGSAALSHEFEYDDADNRVMREVATTDAACPSGSGQQALGGAPDAEPEQAPE